MHNSRFHRIATSSARLCQKNWHKLLVCPETFSHTVMCKVCLAASNTLFDVDAFVQLCHWILTNIWRVRFLAVSPQLVEHIFLAIQFTRHSLSRFFGQGNWGWWAAFTRVLSVRGASSLHNYQKDSTQK